MAQVTLSIAGSDCSSGAGIQADLKTFSSLSVHGLTAVTCVVAETPHQVKTIAPIAPSLVAEQIQLLAETYPIRAIKTGMLYSAEHIEAVAESIRNTSLSEAQLVVDPVMVASTGDPLTQGELLHAFHELLLPHASLITPNLPEAETLLNASLLLNEKKEQWQAVELKLKNAATQLAKIYDTACLLKGGHLEQRETVTDFLAFPASPNAAKITDAAKKIQTQTFTSQRLQLKQSHGTGCSLSAAITANLAKGQTLTTAVNNGRDWLHHALKNSLYWHFNDKETLCINQSEI